MADTYNWSHVIKTVRAFVADNVKTDADTKAYIKLEMVETDKFHDYSSMDQLSEALDSADEDQIWEALSYAVEIMGELITDHFGNAWNFAPGYVKPKKLVVPDVERISRAKWNKLLADAAPKVLEEMKAAAKEYAAHRARAAKASAAKVTDKRIAELATLYKDNLLDACERVVVKQFKKRVCSDDVWFFEMTKEQLESFKTGAEFKAALEAQFTDPSKLFEKYIEIVTNTKAFTSARSRDVWTLMRDRTGKKRLKAAIAKA